MQVIARSICGSGDFFVIDNKYYTAKVPISLATSSKDLQTDVIHEAVVLVVSTDATTTLAEVQDLWSRIDSEEYEIKLAVALCNEDKSRPDWLELADTWFAEQLAEMVLVERLEGKVTVAPDGELGVVGGAEGIQRISEALQAHMWPGMQMKPGGGRRGATVAAAGAADTDKALLEPIVEALLCESFGAEDAEEGGDDLDRLFSEVLGTFH